MVCRQKSVKQMGTRAKQAVPGPRVLSGVGNCQTVSHYGVYQVDLHMYDGSNAELRGICIDEITVRFPTYPLKGAVEDDLNKGFARTKNTKKTPQCT